MRVFSSIALLFITLSCSGPSPSSIDKGKARERIHELLDGWHRAAARADKEAYFAAMDSQAVFIGTDPSERWKKKTFRNWAAPHFQGDTAWAFKPEERHIRIAPQGKIAWADEKLKTWMGTCRGSAVLVRKEEDWKIVHYHLAKTIPNPKMDRVLKLLNEESGKE